MDVAVGLFGACRGDLRPHVLRRRPPLGAPTSTPPRLITLRALSSGAALITRQTPWGGAQLVVEQPSGGEKPVTKGPAVKTEIEPAGARMRSAAVSSPPGTKPVP